MIIKRVIGGSPTTVTTFSADQSPSSGRTSGSHPERSPQWRQVRGRLRHGSTPAAALRVRSTRSYDSRSYSSGWEQAVDPDRETRQGHWGRDLVQSSLSVRT